MTTKLFRTGGFDPLAPGYDTSETVQEPEVAAALPITPSAPMREQSAYLTQGYGAPAPAAAERPVYTEEKSVRIKREYPLDAFAAMHLIGGNGRGRTALYVCPWHDDTADSPNLEVYLPGHSRYGHCKCWRCGGGGTVIDLAMRVFNVSTPKEAMNMIEGKSSFDEQRRAEYAARAQRLADIDARKPAELNPQAHIMAIADWAQQRLWSDVGAMQYLRRRGLSSVAKMLLLGSSTDMPDHVLPKSWDGERGALFPMRSFRDRIVIPYLQPNGTVTYLNARGINESDKKKKYRKPSGVMPEPYLLDVALTIGETDIVMTEGEFDAMSLISALGADPVGVFAVPGLQCFTEQDAAKLVDRRVFICTDADAAGREGRQHLEEMTYGYAKEIHHIRLEEGYGDINEMLVGTGRRNLRGWFMACVQKALQPARKRFI